MDSPNPTRGRAEVDPIPLQQALHAMQRGQQVAHGVRRRQRIRRVVALAQVQRLPLGQVRAAQVLEGTLV